MWAGAHGGEERHAGEHGRGRFEHGREDAAAIRVRSGGARIRIRGAVMYGGWIVNFSKGESQ